MKKITDYTVRTKSLLKESEPLKHLHTFNDFPVFMGCVDHPIENDLVADMAWDIGTETGLIQLQKLLPLDVLYMDQHNDGTGKVWKDHYTAFAEFLNTYQPKHVLEIGGAHDQIAENYWALGGTASWTIVEPNPQHITNEKIKVIKDWFDDNFSTEEEVDTVIHSHVFEHTYSPFIFMEHIGKFLKNGQKHIFTFPTLLPMLEKKWTNCLNFEHTVFLTEDITEYILEKCGFKILEKKYYGNPHSVFYATEKIGQTAELPVTKNHYDEYQKLFMDYVNYHVDMIKDLNEKIEKTNKPVYLFGGHIFSQFLLAFGLKSDKIVSILDNSPMKQGKRLYGTTLLVESPEILKDMNEVNLILKVASYEEEIKKQLTSINDKIVIW